MSTRLIEDRPGVLQSPAPLPRKTTTGFQRLVQTPPAVGLTIGRLVLGGVMFVHASQKVFGWFGGQGFSGTVEGFRSHLGVPAALGVLAILAEFLGSISLIVGFLGRIGAACIIAIMVGAVSLVHAKVGFFMNWMGTGQGEGWEYHILAIGLAVVLLSLGSGAASIDRWIQCRRHAEAE